MWEFAAENPGWFTLYALIAFPCTTVWIVALFWYLDRN